jgi:hypothetical protein
VVNRVAHGAVRAGWGLVLLSRPRPLLTRAGHPDCGSGPVAVPGGRGARHVGQALIVVATGRRDVRLLGVAADLLHAASGVALAVASPRWRRVGVVEAVLATGFAVAGRPSVEE